MKGLAICLLTLFLSACYQTIDVVQYRQVAVTPVVRTTTVLGNGYYGAYGYYGSNYYDYDYNYYDSPLDVTTTRVLYY